MLRHLALSIVALTACDAGSSADASADAGAPPDADEQPDARASDGTPADTYFALAITDDSRNHTGDRLLFLDFADRELGTFDTAERGNRVIQAPVATITIDGDDADWASVPVTTVDARPQNNYPLSAHYDAVSIPIEVAAAYDDERVYLLVRWEDPGHTRSDRHRAWVYDEASGAWGRAPVAALVPGAPNEDVINAADPLSGVEDQDRLMVMFPVRDPEGWFADGGLGCAGLCHANLADSDDPAVGRVGTAAVMRAGAGDALVDLWEWQAALTDPSGHADDLRVEGTPASSSSGIVPDDGEAPYEENGETEPAFMHPDGFSQGPVLRADDAVPLAGSPVDGDTVPGALARAPTGSRADVVVGARYDESTHTWTVELARARDTGDALDRAFTGGARVPPPADVTRERGMAAAGAAMFSAVCSRCHGSAGQGDFSGGIWWYPRVQRASSALIFAALERVEEMRGLPVDETQVEDVAAFLARQHTPPP